MAGRNHIGKAERRQVHREREVAGAVEGGPVQQNVPGARRRGRYDDLLVRARGDADLVIVIRQGGQLTVAQVDLGDAEVVEDVEDDLQVHPFDHLDADVLLAGLRGEGAGEGRPG